jgi:glutathione S-transferase
MKLYYAPGACSLAPHIAACEAGIELQLEKVEIGTKRTEKGKDFLAINPKGYVPALELDGGEILTEGPAIMQFLADHKPEARLAPAIGTLERYRLIEWLGFINSEIHKTYGPLFSPQTSPSVRDERIETLKKRFAFVDRSLGGKAFLLGNQFSVADAYLFVMLSWAGFLKIDLSSLANLKAFQGKVSSRSAVRKALKEEGMA